MCCYKRGEKPRKTKVKSEMRGVLDMTLAGKSGNADSGLAKVGFYICCCVDVAHEKQLTHSHVALGVYEYYPPLPQPYPQKAQAWF